MKNSFKQLKLTGVLLVLTLGLFSVSVLADKISGKQVFDNVCSSCHNGGFRGFISGAPKIGNNEKWKYRLVGGIKPAIEKVWQGDDEHDSMHKEEGLIKQEVSTAINYIISKTPVLKKVQ